MEVSDLKSYLEKIPDDKKLSLLDSLRDSIKNCETYLLSISKWMAFLVFIYFVFKSGSFSSVELFGATITLDLYMESSIPLLFSLLIIAYIITSIHKDEILTSYKFLFENIYGKSSDRSSIIEGLVTQTVPVTIMRKYIMQKDMTVPKGCLFNMILGIPLMIIQILPFAFTGYGLKRIYKEYWENWFSILTFSLTLFFLIASVFIFFNYIIKKGIEINRLKEQS